MSRPPVNSPNKSSINSPSASLSHPSDAQIRPVDVSDAVEIYEILEAARLTSKVNIGPHWSFELLKDECAHSGLALLRPKLDAFILWRDNGSAWEISFLATRPDQQGGGLMRRLLTRMIELRPADRAIWLEVHAENRPAIRLYEQAGFKKTGERKGYYADGGTALNMSLIG